MKQRVYISDHGNFNMFGISVSLPAILELEDDQIAYLKNSGQYNIKNLNASQLEQPKETPLSEIEGSRFDTARTFSVNELAFKSPILGTKYASKAKDAIVVPKNSAIARKAKENNKTDRSRNASILKGILNTSNKTSGFVAKVSSNVKDNTINAIIKEKGKATTPKNLEVSKDALIEKDK